MERFHSLQKECPAYLSIDPSSDSIVILGSGEDQRTSLVTMADWDDE